MQWVIAPSRKENYDFKGHFFRRSKETAMHEKGTFSPVHLTDRQE